MLLRCYFALPLFQVDFALRQVPKSLEYYERTHCRLTIIAGTSVPSFVFLFLIPRPDGVPTGSYSLSDAEDPSECRI